jgi:hypothetical protein
MRRTRSALTCGQGEGIGGDETHEDRHHARDQGGPGGDGGQVGPVTAPPAEEVAVRVRREAEDEWLSTMM